MKNEKWFIYYGRMIMRHVHQIINFLHQIFEIKYRVEELMTYPLIMVNYEKFFHML